MPLIVSIYPDPGQPITNGSNIGEPQAGLTISSALRQSNQRASLENTNLSTGVVGIAFFCRSRNRTNYLRKNRFSAARAVRRRHKEAKKLKPSLTIARRFRTILERRVKALNI